MKTVLFTYESPVGTFWIRPEPADRVQLGLDSHLLRAYPSAKAAARAVADRETGWPPWDSAVEFVVPTALTRWRRPAPRQEIVKHRRTRTAEAASADAE